MLQGFNSSPTLPVFLVEGDYEGENTGFSFPGVTGTFILRAQEYWTMTSGGVGQFYGSHWDWDFASGWQSTLASAGVAQLSYWTTLFTSVEWWKLVPDQNHQIVTAGYGTYNANNDDFYSSNYATTAWNPDGTTSVTYDIAGTALTVNLAKFAGPVSAQWYDPTNGTYQSVTGSPFANTSSRVFQPPGHNQEGYNDWVLVLHANATTAPPPPTNLVVNGSFETDNFNGWTLSGEVQTIAAGPQAFITSQAEAGQFAAGLGPVGSDGAMSQAIPTTPGESYTVTFWLANNAGGPNDFSVKWNDQTLLALNNAPAQGYTEYTYQVAGASGSTSNLEFDFRQDPASWSLDDISVVDNGSTPPPLPTTNLVTNGSFETGSFSGWTVGGNSAPLSYGPQLFVDNTAESGAYAAAFGSVGADGTLSQTIATTAGKSYTLSFWLQNGASGTNDFKTLWNGKTLLSLTNSAQFGYKQYTYSVTATGNASTLVFSAANPPFEWDLDNVSLTLPTLTSETVAITGTAAEGQTLTAKVTDNDPNATISYQWQYQNGSTWTNIAGATAATLTMGVPQEGEMLRVVATAVDGATTLSAASSATTAIKAAAPVLTIAKTSLSVTAGSNVALGVSVTVPEAGDTVNVNIAGLPSYETITDALDGKMFSGSSVTLTAAEVNSGLTLKSSYTGTSHPVATLALKATNGASSAALTTTASQL